MESDSVKPPTELEARYVVMAHCIKDILTIMADPRGGPSVERIDSIMEALRWYDVRMDTISLLFPSNAPGKGVGTREAEGNEPTSD